MAIAIREADLKNDRKLMIDCLLRNRQRYKESELLCLRFDWAFLKNPHGNGRAWLAIDQSNGKVVGFTSAYPRKAIVNGETMFGWNCADFSMDPQYRTLGPAIKLRKAAKNCVNSGDFPFLYAHPNDRMLVVHEKVNHRKIGQMVRYACPLRFNKTTDAILGANRVSSAVASLGNPLLKMRAPGIKSNSKYLFSIVQQKSFGVEFDCLFEKASSRYCVILDRDSEFLTWRFLQNPLRQSICFRMESEGTLKGYVLFNAQAGVAHVVDCFVEGGDDEMYYLLGAFIFRLRKAGYSTISLCLHNTNPFLAMAQKLGFRYRDDATSTVVAYAHPTSSYAPFLLDGKNWFMTVGDRDV